jgi:hypothetical protein
MRNFPQPLWLGKQDIAGKTILLHAEQGYGDTINFCRYAAPVAARGATVILEVQPPLKSLLTGIDGAAQVIGLGEALPAFDYHCPLLSLPLALGTTFETIPATVPYLSPPAETLARWRTRLGEKKNPRVGLAWCGNPAQSNNRRRSVPPAELTPLIHCGATVYCLQKDQGPEDRAWLGAHPEVKDLSRALDSFADTAALASLMDVVITIDSAVAHLGGALGLKTWMMLCFAGVDWRWMLGRADNAWYPTARLYRQDASEDWRPVIAALARDLRALTVNNQTTLSPSGLSRGPRAETKKG